MVQSSDRASGLAASPVPAADVSTVRQPTLRASLLPPRVYHDPAVLAYEEEEWLAKGWVCIGREEDIPFPGSYVLAKLCGENLIIVRDNRATVRAFFNFCRHRGSTLVTEPSGLIPRFQCPYHAW